MKKQEEEAEEYNILDSYYYCDNENGTVTLFNDQQIKELGTYKVWYDADEDGREYIEHDNSAIYLDTIYEV